MRIRILPILIVVIFISVFVKTSDIFLNLFSDSIHSFFKSNLDALAENKEGGEHSDYQSPRESNRAPKKIDTSSKEEEYFDKDLIESLSKRHKELEMREKTISMKESVLSAVEKKIDKKMVNLEVLKSKIEDILKQYKKKENIKIMRLVKIYESMKSADAARIFSDMEVDVLLEVMSLMKETKVAPILAKMDSSKAKVITVGILKRRRLFIN